MNKFLPEYQTDEDWKMEIYVVSYVDKETSESEEIMCGDSDRAYWIASNLQIEGHTFVNVQEEEDEDPYGVVAIESW